MDFQATRAAAAREIALAIGVPPMLLGIPGDNTYANYREANLAFWRMTVLPLAGRVAEALSRWLDGAFQTDVDVALDLDRVPALATEREALWSRLEDATFLTREEKRQLAGLEP
jgi:HK97 family phage portal protein